MNSNNDEKILIEAGLSEEQSAIYSALLDKGPLKAGAIASWTGIKRGLIYKVLDQLKNMGLITEKGGEGTVAVFSPNHPSRLAEIMEQKEKALALAKETVSFSLGALSSKFNLLSGKPNVQFYEGEEGIKKVLEDTLMVPPGTEIYTYADIEAITKYIPEINKDYSNKRESLKIKKRGLVLDTEKAREIIKDYHTDVTETRFIKSDIGEFETVIQIYENKISYITLKNDSMIGVIIEDSSIYKIHKAIFETLWGLIPEVN
jgi:sugar-specific transcriptional regulator TrmB